MTITVRISAPPVVRVRIKPGRTRRATLLRATKAALDRITLSVA